MSCDFCLHICSVHLPLQLYFLDIRLVNVNFSIFFVTDKLGTRHFVTFMLFLGMANAYVMRTNMSVAIVAMVNHTALEVETELVDDECDNDYGNATVSQVER